MYLPTAEAAEVGVAEIIGHNEHNIGPRYRLRPCGHRCRSSELKQGAARHNSTELIAAASMPAVSVLRSGICYNRGNDQQSEIYEGVAWPQLLA